MLQRASVQDPSSNRRNMHLFCDCDAGARSLHRMCRRLPNIGNRFDVGRWRNLRGQDESHVHVPIESNFPTHAATDQRTRPRNLVFVCTESIKSRLNCFKNATSYTD
jgi:hypothetical protein